MFIAIHTNILFLFDICISYILCIYIKYIKCYPMQMNNLSPPSPASRISWSLGDPNISLLLKGIERRDGSTSYSYRCPTKKNSDERSTKLPAVTTHEPTNSGIPTRELIQSNPTSRPRTPAFYPPPVPRLLFPSRRIPHL